MNVSNLQIAYRKTIKEWYVTSNSIKNEDNIVVAKISKDRIESGNDDFINGILNCSRVEDANKKQIKSGYIKYQLRNIKTNQLIALVDNRFNVYDLDKHYLGTLKKKNNPLGILFGGNGIIKTLKVVFTMVVIIASLLCFFSIRSTKSPTPVELITITEADGKVVTDKWNIFTDYLGSNTIYPSQKGTYLFTIYNSSEYDVRIDMDFDEENAYNINMLYQIKQGDEYLNGNNVWESVRTLVVDNLIIKANDKVALVLEWYWKDDDIIDTEAGSQEDVTYTLIINFSADKVKNDK